MKVREFKQTKNELGGIHIKEIVKEVPEPVDYNKTLLAKVEDLIKRQEEILEKLGVTE